METRQDVVVASGTNTLIPISRSQINRLVTPFDSPNIQTVSQAEISTSGNVIYVTTQDDQPVTMFVTPEDDESVAISLTLLPQSIPRSRQTSSSAAASRAGCGYAGDGLDCLQRNRSQVGAQPTLYGHPAFAHARNGRGQAASRIQFRRTQVGDSIPACAQPALSFDFSKSQLIQGHDFRVYVAVAENISGQTVEFDHGACSHPNRAVVSSWPS